MTIFVNGEAVEVRSAGLSDVLKELGYTGMKIATAVNGAFVHREARDATALTEGDRLEVVAPLQGG